MSFRSFLFTVLVATMLLPAAGVFAQDEEKEELKIGVWHHRLEMGINLAQSAYSNNWAGAENNNVAWNANMIGAMQKRYHNGINWATRLQLRFGQSHQQVKENGERVWNKPEQTDDKVDLESVALLEKEWEVDPYMSARYQTVFLDETDPEGRSQVFNPMIFQESAGIARHVIRKPDTDEFMLARFGWTQKQNFRSNFAAPTGDATYDTWTHDGGLELQADWNLLVLEDKVRWVSKVSMYQPLAWSETSVFDEVSADSLEAAGVPTDVSDLALDVDFRWENTFNTQLTKFISFSLYLELLYDQYDKSVAPVLTPDGNQIENAQEVQDAVHDGWQWKQTIGLGFSYRFL
jgi:hypothetical protein